MTAEPDPLEEAFHRLLAASPSDRAAILAAIAHDQGEDLAAAVGELVAAADIAASPLDAPFVNPGLGPSSEEEPTPPLHAPESAARSFAPAPELAPGHAEALPEIPGFRLMRRLGRGGSATVYLAEQIKPGFRRLVALKVLDDVLDAAGLRRVRHEQRILAQLEHPGIARLYDSGVTPSGQPYLAMERVDGETLFAHCQARDLSVSERLALFLDVLDAVEYAHRAAVVHRDLKPANILVSVRGEPKLLDFGIAKLLPGPGDLEETRTLQRAMTLAYASPEQVRGGRVTAASDIYSLGVVLYELLAETLPYRVGGDGDETLEDAIRRQDPEPPSTALARTSDTTTGAVRPRRRLELEERRRALRGDIDAVVLRALRKEPGSRYPSVAELAADLRRVLAGEPVAARRADRRYRATKWIRQHGRRVVGTAVLGAAIAVAVVPGWRGRWLLPLIQVRPADELAVFTAVGGVPPEAQRALVGAARELREGNARAARQRFEQAAALVAGLRAEALAWDGLARAEAVLGEVGKAAAAARRAAALAPAADLPRDELERLVARGLAAEGDWVRAVPALDRLFGRLPGRVDLGLDLVAALLASGQTEAADATLGRIRQLPLQASGASPDPRLDLCEAEVAFRIGEYQRSAAAATRARNWAIAHRIATLRWRAERLHAEAAVRLDLRDEAQSELLRVVEQTAAAGLDRETALSRLAIGKILIRTPDNDRAQHLLDQAQRGLNSAGDRAGEVAAGIALAFLAAKRGELTAGLELAARAVALAQEIGDRWSEGEALNTQLVLMNWAEDTRGVLATREQALRALRDSENRPILASLLDNLALDAIERRDLDRAEAYLDEADGLSRRVGNRLANAGLDRARGYLEESRGANDLARQHYEAALEKARRANHPISTATYLADLAWLEVGADRPDAASARAAEAIAAHQAVGKVIDAVELEGVLAWVEARRGDAAAAFDRRASMRRRSAASEAPSLFWLTLEARIAEALGDWRRAIGIRRRAVDVAAARAAEGALIDQRYWLARDLDAAGGGPEFVRLAKAVALEAEQRGVRGVAQDLRRRLAGAG